MRYTVLLEPEDDGGFVASVPALPGCISQGDSREEALANIREAVALYIEDCREAGDPVPTEIGKEFAEIEVA
ncbi:MAG: type II toxin-antitoxin system HicB family antitoxin [Hyphomicrobiaceae bacterium]|jgi:predicted RNase H-like HicB family nuclease